MKHILTLLFLTCSLSAFCQVNNIYQSGGISQTVGAPTYRPGAKGNIVAIDTVTGTWYVSRDRNSVNWLSMGDRIESISGCSPPTYSPNKYNSALVINNCGAPDYLTDFPKIYLHIGGSVWICLNCALSGTINTDVTLSGDGTGGSPLSISQQGATASQVLQSTGATWEPSWGNPYLFITSGATITSAVNEVLIGTISGNTTIGVPSCNVALDGKHFKFIRNGTDAFSLTIDPAGSELFYDGSSLKIFYGKISMDCTCKYSGTGVWFFDNF